MPKDVVRLPVPHGILIIGDRDEPLPAYLDGAAVAASDSTVAIATLHEVDGEVTVRLARGTREQSLRVRLFSGRLQLPGRRVTICNTANDVLLQAKVPERQARVTVWANRAEHADEIVVAFD